MTGINSLFSQFNAPYAPIYNQNNVPVQNNVAPKEQAAQQPNKKRFNSNNLLIPVGTTAAGGVGGFAAAQLDKNIKNKNADEQIKKYKTTLLEKFNGNSDIKTINSKLNDAEELLKTLKKSVSRAENLIKNESSPAKITKLKDGLNRTIQAKECQESNLNKLNMDLKEKYTNLVEKPLNKYVVSLKDKVAKHNAAFVKKAAIAGTLIGAIIGGIIVFCVKNNLKGKNGENNNAILK